MSLLRPGAQRADGVLDDPSLLRAMVAVEQGWLQVRGVDADLSDLVSASDAARIVAGSEQAGNPVVPLLEILRERLRERGRDDIADSLHRGLTSQDVLDTAVALGLQDTARRVEQALHRQVTALRDLAAAHSGTIRVARTLTQPAVPTTFGCVVAGWLNGVLDAAQDLRRAADFRVQVGGAAGTLAGPATQGDPVSLVGELADVLGLQPALPWHTNRAPITRFGDALVSLHDAWGLIADDVLLASRPEIGELAEGVGGGSSTMPHKHNPVLSVLIRAGALQAPQLGATLHAAAANWIDQRPDGAWHAEWPAVQALGRSTVIVAEQTADLLSGLRVHSSRMTERVEQYADELLAEATKLGAAAQTPADYLGAAPWIVEQSLDRADRYLKDDR